MLGDDGKLDKEDLKRLGDNVVEAAKDVTEKVKGSSLGKAVLGDDGKFDKEDAERLANKAKEAGKDVVDAVKKMFEK